MVEVLSEHERFPLLTEAGRRLLGELHENEFAPRYNHHCGDRLTSDGLHKVRVFESELQAEANGWEYGTQPGWMAEFVSTCLTDVPHYRTYGAGAAEFTAIPTCERADLVRAPWAFVPDSQSLDDLIVYTTTGTSGRAVEIPSHPVVSSTYLAFLRHICKMHGVALEGGAGRVAIVLVCFQRRTLTYAGISSFLGQAGCVKINLSSGEWNHPDDRVRFLDAFHPEIYTGDPIAFAELATLPLETRPKALVSTATTLAAGLRDELESHFGCPVIDVYSANESGPIAVASGDGHAVLPHRLYVEILRADGTVCRPGERGEITLTGGFNPLLPLVRYRTGDYASLRWRGRVPLLIGLQGRAPVVFRSTRGVAINNIDVGQVLTQFALAQFSLHQYAGGALRLRVRGAGVPEAKLRETLLDLFGAGQSLVIEPLAAEEAKVLPYTRDVP